jgi:protein-disulfide isomerase
MKHALALVFAALLTLPAVPLLAQDDADSSLPPITLPDDPAPAEDLRHGRMLGDPDAPVTIDVYEDPMCPHCGSFTRLIEPLLVAGPISNGTANFTYHDFIIFGEDSADAAAAMRVAEDMDGAFWDYHHVLFYNQIGGTAGYYSRERLADIAELVGLDRVEFLERMDDPTYLEAVIADSNGGATLGVQATPSLVINGELYQGSPPWDQLEILIEAMAEGA